MRVQFPSSPLGDKMELLTKEEYFNAWEQDQLEALSEEDKERIYERHKFRKTILDRDGYLCVADGCLNTEELTVHHVKHKRNGGRDSLRNCITLCEPCHIKFNKGYALTIEDEEFLPSHIRGRTFQLHKGVQIDKNPFMNEFTRIARRKRKAYRKEVRDRKQEPLDWKTILMLLMWVYGRPTHLKV